MDDSALAPSLLAAVRILARGGDLVTRLAALAAEAGAVASARSSLVLLHDPEAAVVARPDGTAGSMAQFMIQLYAVLSTFIYTGVVTWILLKIVDVVIGLRVTTEEEREGLDIVLHGERLE